MGYLGTTFLLTSDRQFFSPCFLPCCWNERVLTEASITGHPTRALQWWECFFRTPREAHSGFVGSFHSISWVFGLPDALSVCAAMLRKLSQNSMILAFLFVWSCKMVTPSHLKCSYLKKVFFEPCKTCKCRKFPFFAHFIAIFALWTTRNFSFASEFRELLTLDSGKYYPSAKQAKSFRSAFHHNKPTQGPFLQVAARNVDHRTTLF